MSRWEKLFHSVLRESNWEYARSSGPGGQNVNKVETKAVLRWSADQSQIPFEELEHLRERLSHQLTKAGEILIGSDRFRDRERNRADVEEKLRMLFERCFFTPPTRRKTRPTLASKKRRLESKSRRKETKSGRSKIKY